MKRYTPPMNTAGCHCVYMKNDPEGKSTSYGAGKNMKKEPLEKIVVRGARTHNLKNIDVEMPRNKMVVITGVSGSGKSSLAFDTIFAEGQRRYVESLSSYARQFLNQMPKPDVDEITGLSPAISIDQKSRSNNPRSTVATITEIYDYLRVMYARIGHPSCPLCGEEIKKLSNEEILNFVLDSIRNYELKSSISNGAGKNKRKVMGVEWDETEISIFSPIVRGRKGEYYQLLYDLLGKGFSEIRLDGVMKRLREQITLSKNKAHNIDILVDHFAVHEFSAKGGSASGGKDSINGEARMRLAEAIERALIESDGLVTISFGDVSQEFIMSAKFACKNDGFSFPEVEPRLFSFNSPYGACPVCNGLGSKYFMGDEPCDACHGARLRPEALNVFLNSSPHPDLGANSKKQKSLGLGGGLVNILDLASLSIADAYEFFVNLKLSDQEKEISVPVVREIEARLKFMLDVGLDYLQLSRKANTLSGGEAQRIRLASQLGSRLVGALYVLDEPTIGLHQRDNDKLIKTLEDLRDLGNTVIVVEHDEDTIMASDYMIEIGPGAGVHGGYVVCAGETPAIFEDKKSLTAAYLRGDQKIEVPKERRQNDGGSIRLKGATQNNLKNIDVEFPLRKFVCVTGVSGSGKSTLAYDTMYKTVSKRLYGGSQTPGKHKALLGLEYIDKAILIDQDAIGRTSRSNPATYTGSWSPIRDLFASTAEARFRGYKTGRFSFNVPGGRCENCEGHGEIAIEMHFLPTVYVQCDVCQGKRFNRETLEVTWNEKTIWQVLDMTIEEAKEFFKDVPAVSSKLDTLD